MESNILYARNLSKSFGNLHALDGVTINIPERKISILIGPNGSGKTTFINVVCGFYSPDSGQVVFNNVDITGLPPYKLYAMGMARTFQVPALFWNLTVLENLLIAEKNHPGEAFFKSLLGRRWKTREIQATQKAARILNLLGLLQVWNLPAHQLSGGQMKLVEIGRALMSDAKLLLLDEPVSGVNPTLAHEIFSRILKLRDELGITFFIVEHRLDVALKYVDEIYAMAFGKLIASGRPDEVMNDRRVIEAYLGN